MLQWKNDYQIKNETAFDVILTYAGEVADRLGGVYRGIFFKEVQNHLK